MKTRLSKLVVMTPRLNETLESIAWRKNIRPGVVTRTYLMDAAYIIAKLNNKELLQAITDTKEFWEKQYLLKGRNKRIMVDISWYTSEIARVRKIADPKHTMTSTDCLRFLLVVAMKEEGFLTTDEGDSHD